MATGRYNRIDNSRRSLSKYSSTATVFLFVSICLVVVWVMTSSSLVPVPSEVNAGVSDEELNELYGEVSKRKNDVNSGMSEEKNKVDTEISQDKKNEVKPEVSQRKNGANADLSREKKNEVKPDASQEKNEINADVPREKDEAKPDVSHDKNELDVDGPQKKKNEVKPDLSRGKGEINVDVPQEKKEDVKPDVSQEKNEVNVEKKNGVQPDSTQEIDEVNTEVPQEKKNEGKPDVSQEKVFSDNSEKILEKNSAKTEVGDTVNGKTEEITDQVVKESDARSGDSGQINRDGQAKNQVSNEVFPSGGQSEILNETTTQSGSWSTESVESKKEKEAHKSSNVQTNWKFCNVTAGPDYIPCLDNWKAVKSLPATGHYEHRERHCPEQPPTCLVPLPDGYRRPIKWPMSRDKIWYHNVPHMELVKYKGGLNWVKFTGFKYLTFPGGRTQFRSRGALHYIDFIQESVSDISWGKRSRVVLDVGCGVASFGGYLFDRDVLTMSLASKEEHKAQVQFALERGIPAISAVMGTKRLPFPGGVFDVIHCARCRVPWRIDGGILLLELNRLLRPGGLFVWSSTPAYYGKDGEDVEIWTAMEELTKNMCWETVATVGESVNKIGVAIYMKPTLNECYGKRSQNKPPICADSDDPNAAWNVTLGACVHRVPVESGKRGSQWPQQWPARLESTPYWLLSSQAGVYGKPAPDDFVADCEHWKRVVNHSYLSGIGIDWSTVRNVMDMRAVYGGFAAALKDLDIWVMNVVPTSSADTLPVIYERGLFGIYHDWCESFSTYPGSYDLLHADHIFSTVKKRCNLVAVVAEVDRILRPEGKLIVRDNLETIKELEDIVKSMQWELRLTYSKEKEGLLSVEKSMWRPKEPETLVYAIA